MIPELGHYALILALCLAVVQSIVPLVGSFYQRVACMQLARSSAFGQCVLIAVAFFALAYAFVSNDFSVAYVAENSNRHLPAMYRFCAVWGAHEGSLLLWIFILSLWAVAVAIFSRRLPIVMVSRILAVLGMVSFGFLLFLLTTSNPFTRYLPNFPLDGQDLNPLLQDPGFVIHPPMLYMGYVGFSVAFAFTMAALISGRLDSAWARWSRPWTLIAWCFLTFGIVLGSWWAYRELGWGGWWFWDPVENASFLPWLVGTALVHSLAVTEKRGAFKAWTALLAITAFSLSLLGTFIVRSGVLISVHAFAIDPQRGIFMLKFLAAVVGVSLLLYAIRAHKIRSTTYFALASRETALLVNNLLLTVMMLTVLLGTLYPLVIELLGQGRISVGPPYFNALFVPLVLILVFFMIAAPWLQWREANMKWVAKRLWLSFFVALALAFLLPWLFGHGWHSSVVLALTLTLWLIFSTVQSLFIKTSQGIALKKLSRSLYAMALAHIGVAITVIGVALTVNYSVQSDVHMAPGDTVTVGPYQFRFLGTKELNGPNYTSTQAAVVMSKNQLPITVLLPEQRDYTVQQTALAKTAIDSGVFRDVYVALGEPVGEQSWSFRIYYKPFVRWIWLGGLLMVLAGLLAVSDKRYRLKKQRQIIT